MELKRARYIRSITQEIQEKKDIKTWIITGEAGVGKKHFLHLLEEYFRSLSEKTVFLSFRTGDILQPMLDASYEKEKEKPYILFVENSSLNSIVDLLVSWQDEHKKDILFIVTNDTTEVPPMLAGVGKFLLPRVSWREYRDELGLASDTESYQKDSGLQADLDTAFQTYLNRGSYPDVLASDTDFSLLQTQRWERKYTDMVLQLYKKDEENFVNFLRTLALETGSLLKGDYFAKLVGIPRRKVWEFIDVLTEFSVIDRIQPYVRDITGETSIHDRYYWTDLSYVRALLGDMYMQGTLRQKVLENALYLELKFALTSDHILWFYRKKSQATIPFLLERLSNQELIPITFTERNTEVVPQIFQSFQHQYGTSVKRYIIFTASLCAEMELETVPVLFLPHTLI